MKSRRVLFAASLLAILTMVFLWLGAQALPAPQEKFTPKHPGRFDREEWIWLAGENRPIEARRTMVDDLTAKYLRPGLTHLEVVQLLGPPDWNDSAKCLYTIDEHFPAAADQYTSFASLELDFDTAGTLQSFQLVEN
ncbi:MAG TPA: hypothetical protein VK843_20710 [Planctomycetota bacterium]|nr:hypothetical protein [Planctomycetota bacterium]